MSPTRARRVSRRTKRVSDGEHPARRVATLMNASLFDAFASKCGRLSDRLVHGMRAIAVAAPRRRSRKRLMRRGSRSADLGERVARDEGGGDMRGAGASLSRRRRRPPRRPPPRVALGACAQALHAATRGEKRPRAPGAPWNRRVPAGARGRRCDRATGVGEGEAARASMDLRRSARRLPSSMDPPRRSAAERRGTRAYDGPGTRGQAARQPQGALGSTRTTPSTPTRLHRGSRRGGHGRAVATRALSYINQYWRSAARAAWKKRLPAAADGRWR